jgi:methyl-accepting chemotaxis protein
VAGEVRNLVQRSSSVAKEIKALISDSVSKDQEGTKLVKETAVAAESLVEQAKSEQVRHNSSKQSK